MAHKVLIVDDERITTDTLATIFSQRGFETRAAYSAEQAIEIIAQWQPDLAILDVVLPKLHGVDLAVLLTEKLPECKTLLFSGQALTEDLLARAKEQGYTFAILAKPIHPSLLLDVAAKMLTSEQERQISAKE